MFVRADDRFSFLILSESTSFVSSTNISLDCISWLSEALNNARSSSSVSDRLTCFSVTFFSFSFMTSSFSACDISSCSASSFFASIVKSNSRVSRLAFCSAISCSKSYTGAVAFSALVRSSSVFSVSSTVLAARIVSGAKLPIDISYVTPLTLSTINPNCRNAVTTSTIAKNERKPIKFTKRFNCFSIQHLLLHLPLFYQFLQAFSQKKAKSAKDFAFSFI